MDILTSLPADRWPDTSLCPESGSRPYPTACLCCEIPPFLWTLSDPVLPYPPIVLLPGSEHLQRGPISLP